MEENRNTVCDLLMTIALFSLHPSIYTDENPCLSIPPLCSNGGECVNQGAGEHYCNCPTGYQGDSCEASKCYVKNTSKSNLFAEMTLSGSNQVKCFN